MSRLHELTHLQRVFAEENLDTVFRFLSHKGLSAEDYYDTVIFGYLQAVQEYDEDPALSRLRFSTVAMDIVRRISKLTKNVSQEILCLTKMDGCLSRRHENRLKRKAPTVSTHTCTRDGLTLDEILPDRRKDLQEQTADRLLAMEILSCLTETERQMVHLKADGLTCREIAGIFSTTVGAINARFHRMRVRLMGMDF